MEQLVLQPDFAKSGKLFSSSQLLQSASVATDWEGNERAVSVACSFQCNFMYDPVL